MKPAAFEYLRPASIAEAVAQLGEFGGDAKILAGGQSLVPLLNFRIVRPSVLIDINRLAELDFVEEDGGGLRIGALTRHYTLETSPLVRERFPVLSAAMAHVAHIAIRNRGTIGGSLSHADPRLNCRCWRCCWMPKSACFQRVDGAVIRRRDFSAAR